MILFTECVKIEKYLPREYWGEFLVFLEFLVYFCPKVVMLCEINLFNEFLSK